MAGNYNVILILSIFLLAYGASFLLVKRNKIKLFNQRRFWNYLLLFTFLTCGLSGIIMALIIDYGLIVPWYAKILYWHVETGIVMAVIAIIHTIWHLKYYLSFLKK